ncbi:hypothetical protein H0H81_012566, partial [Sphagnurus paluster]
MRQFQLASVLALVLASAAPAFAAPTHPRHAVQQNALDGRSHPGHAVQQAVGPLDTRSHPGHAVQQGVGPLDARSHDTALQGSKPLDARSHVAQVPNLETRCH